MTKQYSSSLEHIIDELHIVDAYIQRKFDSMKQNSNSDNDELSGLIISDSEIENALKHLRQEKSDFTQISQNLDEEIHTLKSEIDATVQNSVKGSISLRLQMLVEKFNLSSFEKMILLFCIAPEFDKRYSTIYAFLQNNITKKLPSSQMILDTICESIMERLSVRAYFSPQSPLFRYGIVKNSSDNDDEFHALYLDKSIIQYLLDNDKIDDSIDSIAHLERDLEPVKLTNKNIITKLEHVFTINTTQKDKVFIVLSGLDDASKKNTVSTLSHNLQQNILNVDISLLKQQKDFEIVCTIIMRESILYDAILYLENFDEISNFEHIAKFFSIIDKLYVNSNMILVDMKNPKSLDILSNLNTFVVEIPQLTFSETKSLWIRYFGSKFTDETIDDLSAKFRFNEKQIRFIAELTLNSESSDPLNTLYEICKNQSVNKMPSMTKKIHSSSNWDDLILPDDKKHQIQDIINYVKTKNQVYDEWKFANNHAQQGLNVLFSGDSGTGKTLAASVIANELGLELYKIDLANVVSKYIGETEKNIDQIFSKFQNSNSILFFDEADALFGKRTDISDSHDRHANIEVGYLLQKLEEHGEIVILASNLSENIDDAFRRRMNFWVEFHHPSQKERLEIWKKNFPVTSPVNLSDDDYVFLSNKFNISGTNIANIALAAAFSAAEKKSSIDMSHVVVAIKKEYQKIARPLTKSEFGPYFDLLLSKQ